MPVESIEMFSATVPPGAAAPEERLSEALWALQQRQAANTMVEIRTKRQKSAG